MFEQPQSMESGFKPGQRVYLLEDGEWKVGFVDMALGSEVYVNREEGGRMQYDRDTLRKLQAKKALEDSTPPAEMMN